MDKKNNNKKRPEIWRIIIFIISVIFIIFMWCKNDIIEIYTTMPQDQIIPMIATTLVVSTVKVVVIAGIIIIIKYLFDKLEKFFKKDNED